MFFEWSCSFMIGSGISIPQSCIPTLGVETVNIQNRDVILLLFRAGKLEKIHNDRHLQSKRYSSRRHWAGLGSPVSSYSDVLCEVHSFSKFEFLGFKHSLTIGPIGLIFPRQHLHILFSYFARNTNTKTIGFCSFRAWTLIKIKLLSWSWYF